MKGRNISRLYTLGTWYDNGYIGGEARIAGKKRPFRIHVTELHKMMGTFNFDVDLGNNDKRRKHIYLTIGKKKAKERILC